MALDILLVGAGAVGQVFAHHLARGGARVSFYVRPKYADSARAGFTMVPLGRRHGPERLIPDAVLTTIAEVAARRWDAVFLCTSSTALRQGTWLADLGPAIGNASLVAIQPGLDDRALVAEHVPVAQIVWGMFPLIAYATSDVGGTPADATAFWMPPLAKLPLGGDASRTRPLVDALTRGGLPARAVADVSRDLAFNGPLLNLHVIGLECAGWSFAALRRDRQLLADVHAAYREARATVEKRLGGRAPLPMRLLRPWMSRLLLALAPRLVPLPVEPYFRVHFTKVGDQTETNLHDFAAEAERLGLPADALRRLAARRAEIHRQAQRQSA